MKIVIMSDIHGNLNAYCAVLREINKIKPDKCILLGDIIDYGMRSNEVIQALKNFPCEIVCSIWGNHENAIINGDFTRFSSARGQKSAEFTKRNLSAESIEYLNSLSKTGKCEFILEDKKCLAVHGSLQDVFWKSIQPSDDLAGYSNYDYVFSGHSHLPHYFEKFYPCDDPSRRNKKKTVFVNSGSVGQPRNLNTFAQFAVLELESGNLEFKKVKYDISDEQSYFSDEVDEFYKIRLSEGV